jgi:hypothetical protein
MVFEAARDLGSEPCPSILELVECQRQGRRHATFAATQAAASVPALWGPSVKSWGDEGGEGGRHGRLHDLPADA